MKKTVFLLIFTVLYQSLFSQTLSYLKGSAFEAGETLKYKIKYGFFTAAEATLQVTASDVKFEDKPTLHLIAQGKTSGTFDIFYKVRSRYDSYIDNKSFTPYLYTENINEDKYKRADRVRFYQDEKKVIAKKGTFKSPVEQTFDLISAYYFARNLDLSQIKKGDKISIHYFLDDEISNLKIEYVGKELVKTSLGKINCLKFSPSINPGRIFRKDSKLYLWITDDANRIPVRAEAEVLVGSIILELSSSSGLKSPVNSKL